MKKLKEKSKRAMLVVEHGYDTKFAAHTLRLLCECEQILATDQLDLTMFGSKMKSIRAGEWPLEDIEAEFARRQASIEHAHATSALPERPDQAAIKELLLDCLEEHFGSLKYVSAFIRN